MPTSSPAAIVASLMSGWTWDSMPADQLTAVRRFAEAAVEKDRAQRRSKVPASLEEGLRQSAAGEVISLGSFIQYAGEPHSPTEGLRVTSLPPKERRKTINGYNYELFAEHSDADGTVWLPIRPCIVAEYTEHGLGYLFQDTPEGFRFIAVEDLEEDEFGPASSTLQAALQSAVEDWRRNGPQRGSFGWFAQLEKAAAAATSAEAALAALSSMALSSE